jgi:thiol-disulfide isomerase/thioredoxin
VQQRREHPLHPAQAIEHLGPERPVAQHPAEPLVQRAAGLAAVLVVAGALFVRAVTANAPDTSGSVDQATLEETVRTDAQAAAPTVAFERFDGGPARLDDWRGRPVVVNFWASWCPPCVAEMRDAFEPLHREFGDRVAFLGVNLQDTTEAALAVVAQTGVTHDLARDPDGALFTAFGGFGMPTTALIDEAGVVVARHTGALTQAQLAALIRDHLLAQ